LFSCRSHPHAVGISSDERSNGIPVEIAIFTETYAVIIIVLN